MQLTAVPRVDRPRAVEVRDLGDHPRPDVADLRSASIGSRFPRIAPQKNDEDYTKRILDNTPDKRILTQRVDHMPVSATVPSPLKFPGYVPGENNRFTCHKDILAYYQPLR